MVTIMLQEMEDFIKNVSRDLEIASNSEVRVAHQIEKETEDFLQAKSSVSFLFFSAYTRILSVVDNFC